VALLDQRGQFVALKRPWGTLAPRRCGQTHEDVLQRGGTPIIPTRKSRQDPELIDDFLYA
ncbi:MAG: hypothetical protein AAF334_06460, partial [Pseudomonadota bacterium]